MPDRERGARRTVRVLVAMAVFLVGACDYFSTFEPDPPSPFEPETEEPDTVLSVAHVRVCYTLDGGASSKGDCMGNGYWGNERVPTRNEFAVPLSGVPVRICYFSAFHDCHARTAGHFRTAETDSAGYAVFPGLVKEGYLFLPDVEEVEVDSCTFVPINEYGGALWVSERVLTTPVEYQNSHIGELWFIKTICERN